MAVTLSVRSHPGGINVESTVDRSWSLERRKRYGGHLVRNSRVSFDLKLRAVHDNLDKKFSGVVLGVIVFNVPTSILMALAYQEQGSRQHQHEGTVVLRGSS